MTTNVTPPLPQSTELAADDAMRRTYQRSAVMEYTLCQNDVGTGVVFGPTPCFSTPSGIPLDSQCVCIEGRYYHAIEASGDSTGVSVAVECSLTGLNWITVTTIAALGITQWTGLFKYLRATIATNSGGTAGLSLQYNGRF